MRSNDPDRQLSDEEVETDSAGQSGDIQGMSRSAEADSESVERVPHSKQPTHRRTCGRGQLLRSFRRRCGGERQGPRFGRGLHPPSARGRCTGRISQQRQSRLMTGLIVFPRGRPRNLIKGEFECQKLMSTIRVPPTITKEPPTSSRKPQSTTRLKSTKRKRTTLISLADMRSTHSSMRLLPPRFTLRAATRGRCQSQATLQGKPVRLSTYKPNLGGPSWHRDSISELRSFIILRPTRIQPRRSPMAKKIT